MSKITKVHARQVFDSRGNPTIEAEVTLENNIKAIISGNNTTKIDLLYLKENLSFNDNDLVYTSGDGGYFNPGIPVGVIKKENNNVYINPLNDLSQVQYINIFINQFKNF